MAFPHFLLLLLGLVATRRLGAEPLALPDHLVALDTEPGQALLRGAEARAGYAALHAHFEMQRKPASCGPTTMAMLLNALAAGQRSGAAPRRPEFDQRRVFTPAVEALRPRRKVERNGMPLALFAEALRTHGVAVGLSYVAEMGVDDFRRRAAAELATAGRFVAVNYLRPALGQEGAGHISPLAAYHGGSDRFLILDVARRRYPPVWVETQALFDAMTPPGGGRSSRGFVTVGRG